MRKFLLALFIVLKPVFFYPVLVEYNWKGNSPEYHIMIGTNSVFYYPLIDDTVSNTNYLVDLEPKDYFVKIASIYRGIEGSFSKTISFTVITNGLTPSSRITNIRPVESAAMDDRSHSNTTRWNWIVTTNSPVNADPLIYYSVNSPSGFKTVADINSVLDLSYLKEGDHILFYRLVNSLKTESRLYSKEITIDRTPPEILLKISRYEKMGNDDYLYPESKLIVSVSDNQSPSDFSFWINGRSVNQSEYTIDKSTNFLKAIVIAWDAFGNESILQRECYVDNKAPFINGFLDGKPLLSTTNFTSPQGKLSFQIADNAKIVSSLLIMENQTNYYNPGSAYPLNKLQEGTYDLSVQAADIFGNASQMNLKLIIADKQLAKEIQIIEFPR
jgi:hypothetical protein